MPTMKPLPLRLLLLLMPAILAACATTSSPRSTEPTPAIDCDEHAPDAKLPAYPAAPALGGLGDAAALAAMRAYSDAQAQWAIAAAGVVRQNKILRGSTAACLDGYRKRGVIL